MGEVLRVSAAAWPRDFPGAGRRSLQDSGAGCWLLAAGCWLLAAGCWLLAAGCWLLAAGAQLYGFVGKVKPGCHGTVCLAWNMSQATDRNGFP
jgi:hypothetical protein